MNKATKKRNHLVLQLLVAVGLLLPVGASAQGGVFGRGKSNSEANRNSTLMREGETTVSVSNQLFGNHIEADDITNQTFGTPLGSGMLIMLAASAGYATIKTRKRNKKNNQ